MMCTVSMITDSFMQQWPLPQMFPPMQWPLYQDLLDKARKYDELMAQPNCPDPAKIAWQRAIEVFMREKYGLEPK